MMIEYIGRNAMLEQLAEEATELAKAALKLARIYRGENPTPVTESQAIRNLIEEYTDVEICARELRINVDQDIVIEKMKRFRNRIDAWNNAETVVDDRFDIERQLTWHNALTDPPLFRTLVYLAVTNESKGNRDEIVAYFESNEQKWHTHDVEHMKSPTDSLLDEKFTPYRWTKLPSFINLDEYRR